MPAAFTSYIVQIIPAFFRLDPVTTAIWLLSFYVNILNIFHRTMTYASSVRLTSFTPTRSNLFHDITLATILKKLALYKLLIFHVTNLMSTFLSLGRASKNPPKSEAFYDIS
jgi:hypothetical protein